MATGGAEIYAAVVQCEVGNAEAGVRTAVSVEAEFPFGLVHDVLRVHIEEPQQLQRLPPILVVPEDHVVILDGV